MGEDKKHVEYGRIKQPGTKEKILFNMQGIIARIILKLEIKNDKMRNAVLATIVVFCFWDVANILLGIMGFMEVARHEYRDVTATAVISDFTRGQDDADKNYKKIKYFNIVDGVVIHPTVSGKNGRSAMVISDSSMYNSYDLDEVLKLSHQILIYSDTKEGKLLLKGVGARPLLKVHNLKVKYENMMDGYPTFSVIDDKKYGR